MLKQTARTINTMLQQFCVDPMGANQIHGFFLGLMAGPDEVEENLWLTELFHRDIESAKSTPSFDSFPHLREYVQTCEKAFNEAYEELTGGEPAKGQHFEDRTDEDTIAAARDLSEGFLRGFRLAGGMEDESRLDDAAVRAFSVLYALARPERTAEILESAENPEELSDARLVDLVPAAVLKLAFVMHGNGQGGGSEQSGGQQEGSGPQDDGAPADGDPEADGDHQENGGPAND
jgi:yecA family protein